MPREFMNSEVVCNLPNGLFFAGSSSLAAQRLQRSGWAEQQKMLVSNNPLEVDRRCFVTVSPQRRLGRNEVIKENVLENR
jgi:hypothetical protein